MNKVYIFNKNDYPLREIFKGEEVTILAKDYWRDKQGNKKELDLFEANDFRGQYHPVPMDMSGRMINDPRNYKMIDMIPVEGAATVMDTTPAYRCMARDCKHISPSPEELEAHTKARHGGLDKLALPDEDARLNKKIQKAA
jgi:hypothetical protein